MKYESLHPHSLQAPIPDIRSVRARSQTCTGRTLPPHQPVGRENCSCPAFLLLDKRQAKLCLIRVFSVLLLDHETVETTAEEKYLISTLEMALLQTGLYGNT